MKDTWKVVVGGLATFFFGAGVAWGVMQGSLGKIQDDLRRCDIPTRCEQIIKNEHAIDKLSEKMDRSTQRIIEAIERLAP